MKNLEALEKFEQANDAMIDRLFWIAGSIESSNLKDLFEEMDENSLKKYFPEMEELILSGNNIDRYEFRDKLIDIGKFGFIAEIHIPIATGFLFNSEGKPTAWSSSRAHCRVDYVYAESIELLMAEIENISEKHFKEFIEQDKKKKEANS
jgi:predicted HAD superfamily Cof-like phosphohydrolase